MYYLSVYVKSFKELFLYVAKRSDFSKASAKVQQKTEPTK
ncbi:transcriptional regulator [Prevotella sp. AM34-19LB]|nr:transcriptional regulator [Prevotella sp. AM34-19LB]